ncbi:MAG: glycosyltransferase family 4 protein [Vicinamibacterales bacterium]
MRILHLTSFVQGGAGQALTELALGQRRAGHAVSIVTSSTAAPSGANVPELLARLALGGVEVHLVDSLAARQTGPNADVVQFIHDQLGTAASFDVLHTHGTVPSVIAIAASRKVTSRVPILQTTHEWRVGRAHAAPRSYDLEVMNLVDRAVVPTWSVADHFAAHGVVRRQLAVVPYGVRTEPPTAPGDALQGDMHDWRAAGGAVLCYVGAPGSTHDERLLSQALPFIDPGLKLLCVLFGPSSVPAGMLETDAVRVIAAGAGRPVRQYLHDADFLVLPSGDGDQPLAVLEAFCDQVPVVASRVPELTEFIDEGQTGWLFDPADPKALAETLATARRAAPHAVRSLCQRARVLYQSEFTVDRMVSGYMREYARLA